VDGELGDPLRHARLVGHDFVPLFADEPSLRRQWNVTIQEASLFLTRTRQA